MVYRNYITSHRRAHHDVVGVVGGMVRGGRLKQKVLNSEAPDDAVSQVSEHEIKWGL